ncbi:hypothetical protein Q3G72_000621 [Acer saccharum]|nr:hypothetical protein Q3G72_000621 [Acer saccharum]
MKYVRPYTLYKSLEKKAIELIQNDAIGIQLIGLNVLPDYFSISISNPYIDGAVHYGKTINKKVRLQSIDYRESLSDYILCIEKRVENRNKRKLDLDWGLILPERPAELIVEKDGQPRVASNAYSDDSAASGDEIDPELANSKLKRMKATYDNFRFILTDKGEMLLRTIKRLEDKRQRRRLLRAEMDVDGCEKPTQSLISGASDTYRQGTASSQFQS